MTESTTPKATTLDIASELGAHNTERPTHSRLTCKIFSTSVLLLLTGSVCTYTAFEVLSPSDSTAVTNISAAMSANSNVGASLAPLHNTAIHIVIDEPIRMDVYLDASRERWHIVRHEERIYRHILHLPGQEYSFVTGSPAGARGSCMKAERPVFTSITADQLHDRFGGYMVRGVSSEFVTSNELFEGCEDMRSLLTASMAAPMEGRQLTEDCAVCELDAELDGARMSSGLHRQAPTHTMMLLDLDGAAVVAFMDLPNATAVRWHLVSNATLYGSSALLHHTVYNNGTLYSYETDDDGAILSCSVEYDLPLPDSTNLTVMELMSLDVPNTTNATSLLIGAHNVATSSDTLLNGVFRRCDASSSHNRQLFGFGYSSMLPDALFQPLIPIFTDVLSWRHAPPRMLPTKEARAQDRRREQGGIWGALLGVFACGLGSSCTPVITPVCVFGGAVAGAAIGQNQAGPRFPNTPGRRLSSDFCEGDTIAEGRGDL